MVLWAMFRADKARLLGCPGLRGYGSTKAIIILTCKNKKILGFSIKNLITQNKTYIEWDIGCEFVGCEIVIMKLSVVQLSVGKLYSCELVSCVNVVMNAPNAVWSMPEMAWTVSSRPGLFPVLHVSSLRFLITFAPWSAEMSACPACCFSHVHLDLVGPLPSVDGFIHVLLAWGFPSQRDPLLGLLPCHCQLDCQFWHAWDADIWQRCSIHFLCTGLFLQFPWHQPCDDILLPTSDQQDGYPDAMHCCLKTALEACHSSSSWLSELPWILLDLKSLTLESTGEFTAELVCGSPPWIPCHFLSSAQLLSLAELLLSKFLNSLHWMLVFADQFILRDSFDGGL